MLLALDSIPTAVASSADASLAPPNDVAFAPVAAALVPIAVLAPLLPVATASRPIAMLLLLSPQAWALLPLAMLAWRIRQIELILQRQIDAIDS